MKAVGRVSIRCTWKGKFFHQKSDAAATTHKQNKICQQPDQQSKQASEVSFMVVTYGSTVGSTLCYGMVWYGMVYRMLDTSSI